MQNKLINSVLKISMEFEQMNNLKILHVDKNLLEKIYWNDLQQIFKINPTDNRLKKGLL